MIRGKGSLAEIKGIGLRLFRSGNSESAISLNPPLVFKPAFNVNL